MYKNENFIRENESSFIMEIPKDKNFRILQLTDLHLGFGCLSKKADAKAIDAIKELVSRSNPDLIMLTGDSIFPFLPKAGTRNNEKQGKKSRLLCAKLFSYASSRI